MAKDTVAVLEVGSQKITFVIGSRGVNGTFVIKALFEQEYVGFFDGDFLDINSLAFAVKKVITDAVKSFRLSINKLYVGVPGEFCTVKTRECSIEFSRKRKIKESDVTALHSKLALSKNSDYIITDVSAVRYVLGDGRSACAPIGQTSEKLGGLLTFVLCDKYYCSVLTAACKGAGNFEIQFISEVLAEGAFLFSEKKAGKIFADVGYLTSTLAVFKGNGVPFLKSFSYGGGNICSALMESFDISVEQAEALKRKINLGYDKNDFNGVYRVGVGDEEIKILVQTANAVVRSSLDKLAELLGGNLIECADLPEKGVIALTGGGVSYIRGAKEYLSARLGYEFDVISARIPLMSHPNESALLSLLNLALNKAEGKIIY